MYLYDLKLRVDTGVHVYNSDTISLRTSGLLGEKNVEITPLEAKPGIPLKIIDDQVIFASESGSVEDTLKQFKEVTSRATKALDTINDILEAFNKEEIVTKIARTVENIQSITASINMPEDINAIITNTHTLTDRALKSWTSVDSAIENINAVALNARGITNDISKGKGTLGKLITNDDLYLRTSSIMSKLETTLDDINHYGLMFHSDKGWQRLRARRLNLMQKLRTPQEFRNYFNDEIDQITTSLSRVYMVMEEVGNSPCCTNMLENKDFTKVFAELMRRVVMLEEEVRMYNTQIVETQVHETELGPSRNVCKRSKFSKNHGVVA